MQRMNKRMVASLALVAVLLAMLTAPVWGQSAATRFSRLIVNNTLSVVGTSALTGDVTMGDDLTVTDDAAVTDDLTTANLILAAQTGIVVANDTVIAPTGSYQPISAAGAVGTASITVGTAGSVLTLVNTSSNTITLTDTGTLKLAGNIALGQFDALNLISDGTNWVQTAPVGNN